ncbi:MAG: hypothetical protein HC789_03110 [Microcoleus sp. CSU_2_2]|nr:hypothetical protein [Microcoleus sp. SU_5_3]NJS09426.1 hypothetical protein [Microcoleus sp. CSU_2_2]
MAQITNQTLTLTPFVEGGVAKVNIQVTYDAVFSVSERALTTPPFNWKFLETIQVVGVDLPLGTGEILLEKVLPVQEIPVTAGPGSLTVTRIRTVKALRTLLQEDPAPGDADEIRCHIQILPVSASEFTPQQVLAG